MEIKILNDGNAELFDGKDTIASLKLNTINNRFCVTEIFIKESYKDIYSKIDIANIIFGTTNKFDILFKEENKNVQ